MLISAYQLSLEVNWVWLGAMFTGSHTHHRAPHIQLFHLGFLVPSAGGKLHQHIV